jgi:hypothetical protein
VNHETRRYGGERAGVQHHLVRRVAELEMHVVGRGAVIAMRLHRRGDGLRRAEQHERLVDQMRAEVEQQTAAARRVFAPALTHERTEAVEMRFEVRDAAKLAAFHEVANGEEVAVPAAVVERREEAALLCGEIGERAGFGGGERDRLVDHHVLAGFQRASREVEVRVVGRGDDDAFDVAEREQRVEVGHHGGRGEVGTGALGLAGCDGGNGRAAAMGDDRRVKRLAGEAVAHHTCFQRSSHESFLQKNGALSCHHGGSARQRL